MNREISLSTPEDWVWFYEKVAPRLVVGTYGCVEWSGPKFKGYGEVTRSQHLKFRVHRVTYTAAFGPIPDGMEVDHRCHNKACANPAHLRLVNGKQNHENQRGPYANNTSGYRGVRRSRGKWRADVLHNGVKHFGGTFDTPEEANEAAIALRNRLFTHNDSDRETSNV